MPHHWFDATREVDDPVFCLYFGSYENDDNDNATTNTPRLPLLDFSDLQDLRDPTTLSLAALKLNKANYKNQLQDYCQSIMANGDTKSPPSSPEYRTVEVVVGVMRAREFQSTVVHGQEIFGEGTGTSKETSEMAAAKEAWTKITNEQETQRPVRAATAKKSLPFPLRFQLERATMSVPFRAAAKSLPYPVRFQLERAILSHPCLCIKEKPAARASSEVSDTAHVVLLQEKKALARTQAHKLLLVYLRVVLPPLLQVSWTKSKTLTELFAAEIWDALARLDPQQGQIDFGVADVTRALERATFSLRRAEQFCQATELQLDSGDANAFDIVQKRSLWPTVEYRCQIRVLTTADFGTTHHYALDKAARLEPSGFDMRNNNHCLMSKKGDKFSTPPSTRRALRQPGWHVRDRFLTLSKLEFEQHAQFDPFTLSFCNRKYEFLFDKRTGKPDVWLYSSPKLDSPVHLSREGLLEALGSFDSVQETKLGDSIGLAFSETTPVVKLSLDQIITVEEVVRGGICFTEGAGVYGIGIASKVKEIFMLDDFPGAIQVCMGGIMGVLSLKRDFPQHCVGIRSSMVKFKSNHTILEVKAVARIDNGEDNKLNISKNSNEVETAWMVPDWTTTTTWKPTMTAKFHHHLRLLSKMDQNVALNTLLALAKPALSQLSKHPVRSDTNLWQKSSLSGYRNALNIVWVAKEYQLVDGPASDVRYCGVIEVFFVGSAKACLDYLQISHVPKSACRVKKDMSGIVPSDKVTVAGSNMLDHSWTITNDLQAAIFDEQIDSLPEGLFVLDPHQEQIVTLPPPVLLESRSGTGKTNCLFCHALSYARKTVEVEKDDHPTVELKPICFITVSAPLSRTLAQRYKEVERIEKVTLPSTSFFSLQVFLEKLLSRCQVGLDPTRRCTFSEYVGSRKSHNSLTMDPRLVENEIGGCIQGSLAAALNRKFLTRQQYMGEIRSNVPGDSKDGLNKRGLIYNEFEKYRKYKQTSGKHDVDDVVLRLIEEDLPEFFQSVYIDEVQDFSYASLFLICIVAGRTEARWVAAGDTAQMITPGCSFTFNGFKQTLREVRRDVKISKVERLTRNYRTSKGVLLVGNAILELLKENYPSSIEYAPTEIAMKDLGLPVVLLDWDEAIKSKQVSFGVKQAIIFTSSVAPSAVVKNISRWVGEHPFILSSLDSKGLEFEDVIIHAFNFPRQAWNIRSKSFAGLQLLRELYVAVTRAQQRVVILIKKNRKEMAAFFRSLLFSIEEATPESILVEFQKTTSPDDWFLKGAYLYEQEKYELAASCYKAASQFGWMGRARGHFQLVDKDHVSAKTSFRTAARIFFDSSEFKNCLDTLIDLFVVQPWEVSDNELLDDALKKEPDHLPRSATLNFALFRERWNVIDKGDLMNSASESIFAPFRSDNKLKEIVRNCSDMDCVEIAKFLPNIIGDYRLEHKELSDATRLFIRGRDFESAWDTTETALKGNISNNAILESISEHWLLDRDALLYLTKYKANTRTSLLVSLFESPRAASTQAAGECMRILGKDIVKLAVMKKAIESDVAGLLHKFDAQAFQKDILASLVKQRKASDVVEWFLANNNEKEAIDFVSTELASWTDDELLSFIPKLLPNSNDRRIIEELECRSLLTQAARICLTPDRWDLAFAETVSNKALKSVEGATRHVDSLLTMWQARRNDARVVASWKSGKDVKSSIRLLLALFKDPQSTGRAFGKVCFTRFGERIVRQAVLGKQNLLDVDAVLRLFDKTLVVDGPKMRSTTAPTLDCPGAAKKQEKKMSPRPGVDEKTSQPPPDKQKARRAPGSAGAGSKKFASGDRVILSGLIARPSLNGQVGSVKSQCRGGRFAIVVEGEAKPLSIKDENLKTIHEQASVSDEKTHLRKKVHRRQSVDYSSSKDGVPEPLKQSVPRSGQRQRIISFQENRLEDSSCLSGGISVPSLHSCKHGTSDSSSDDSSSSLSSSGSADGSSDDGSDNCSSDGTLPSLIHRQGSSDSSWKDNVPEHHGSSDGGSDDCSSDGTLPSLIHRQGSSDSSWKDNVPEHHKQSVRRSGQRQRQKNSSEDSSSNSAGNSVPRLDSQDHRTPRSSDDSNSEADNSKMPFLANGDLYFEVGDRLLKSRFRRQHGNGSSSSGCGSNSESESVPLLPSQLQGASGKKRGKKRCKKK